MTHARYSFICSASMLLLAVGQASHGQLLNTRSEQPFSGDPGTRQSAVLSADASVETGPAGKSDVRQTSWFSLPMPKITMPQVTMPKVSMPTISQESMAKAFAPINAGAQKVSNGTRKAWEGTKQMLTFGQKPDTTRSPHINRKKKPSMWQRLFTPKEPEPPRTVAEWMAQPRPKP